MNKKILIGCILAVVIFILVSFTGVVGYQTIKSSTIARASPLFTVRNSRAIDEESKDLTCEYVGKGEDITISLPTRDNRDKRIVLFQNFIDIINKMDDEAFHRFIDSFINRMRQDYRTKEENLPEMINELHQIRVNPEGLGDDGFLSDVQHTINDPYPDITICFWFPGCVPWLIFWSLTFVLTILYIYVINLLTISCCSQVISM